MICAVMMVRNEADILRINLLHHFAAGVDRFFIVDNGSTDGTAQMLAEMSSNWPVEWKSDAGPYRQSEITTELAREAVRAGADWVLPVDADEFWYSPYGSLRAVLEASSAGALRVEVLNFAQRRAQNVSTPEGLLHLTRRAAYPCGPAEAVRGLVESRQCGYVEAVYSPKLISRASDVITIAMGNHAVSGIHGRQEPTDRIVCLHAPLRSRAALEAKVEQGRRVAALGLDPQQGWHVRRWVQLYEKGDLEREWLANSYSNGSLDVYGVPRPLVFDPRLRDVIRPWLISGGADRAEPGRAHGKAALLRTMHEQLMSQFRQEERASARLREEVGIRDRTIRELQGELHAKVAERDQLIRSLQAELQDKTGERDRIITALQAELAAKVADRDRLIRGLQVELQEKAEERDRIIVALQTELANKVSQREEIISGLQRSLQSAVEEHSRLTAELRFQIAKDKEALRQTGAQLNEIRASRTWRMMNILDGLLKRARFSRPHASDPTSV